MRFVSKFDTIRQRSRNAIWLRLQMFLSQQVREREPQSRPHGDVPVAGAHVASDMSASVAQEACSIPPEAIGAGDLPVVLIRD